MGSRLRCRSTASCCTSHLPLLVTAISQLLNQVPLRENEAASTPVHFRFCVTNRKGMLWRSARPRTAGSVHAPARERCRRVDFPRGHSDQPLMIFRRPPSHQWVA
jgi:hypothetical protein